MLNMSPKCGLPLETLEEKILALMRKMLRDGRVRICSSNVEQCSYLSELLAPGRFTSRHFNPSAANTPHISLPVMTRLTNDLRSRPVRGPPSWTWLQKSLQVLTTFLGVPESASLLHPLLSTRMFAPLMSRCQFAILMANVVAFISNLGGQTKSPKCSKVGL
jgi:hypothetical protein